MHAVIHLLWRVELVCHTTEQQVDVVPAEPEVQLMLGVAEDAQKQKIHLGAKLSFSHLLIYISLSCHCKCHSECVLHYKKGSTPEAIHT